MNSISKVIYGLLIFLAIFSCKKNETVDLSTLQTFHNLAIPLVSAEIDVQDMLEGDTGDVISTGVNGELFLAYVTPTTTMNASEIVDISDQNATSVISLGQLPSVPVGMNIDTSINFSIELSLDSINAYELTSIDFTTGLAIMNIVNNFNNSIDLKVRIPSLIDVNSDFYESSTILMQPNSTNQILPPIDLSYYTLDLSMGSNGFNQMLIEFEATIYGSGNPIDSSNFIEFNYDMFNLEFETIYGDLKYQQFDLGEVPLEIDIFKNSEQAVDFLLTNPEITHTIENSFGFSPKMGMLQMYYEDLQGVFIDDITYDPASSGNNQPAPFYFPAIQQPQFPGTSVTSMVSMNADNSSIDSLINATPKQIISNPVVAINDPNTAVSNSNFISNSSEISVTTEITLPLEGYAGGWVMGDTIPFDFKVDELFSSETEINEAVIKFVTTNGWPLEVTFTLQLLDSNFNVLSSIADSTVVIQSGILDPLGKVVSPTIKVTNLACDSGCVDNLNETRNVILLVTANTADFNNQQSIKIYNDYKLGLSMALLISGRMF